MAVNESGDSRRRPRYGVEVRVQIMRGDKTQTYVCRDVSEHGLFVHTDDPFENGESVQVRIFLPGTAVAPVLKGEVVRVSQHDEGGVAIRLQGEDTELEQFARQHGADILRRGEKRLVLVEPDADARFFLRTVLGIDGYKVEIFEGGASASERLLQPEVDLLIGDPLARVADDEPLAEWASQHFTKPVIFVFAGEMLGEDMPAGRNWRYLEEPVDIGALRDALDQLLLGGRGETAEVG